MVKASDPHPNVPGSNPGGDLFLFFFFGSIFVPKKVIVGMVHSSDPGVRVVAVGQWLRCQIPIRKSCVRTPAVTFFFLGLLPVSVGVGS